ncbi:hypothetical protein C1645_813292 [Glomus cerebriforme]|uniref:Uncharacterized protein n=1 Tax=Glomus cerebriforme TaxID=658196 RepID=A0A397TIJ9_9GLOM|nr:hypothetical protein C1645_813292 [Glomus cerebriforme]
MNNYNNYQNYLLDCIDYDSVSKLPYDNNPQLVADQSRSLNIRFLSGMSLLRRNIKEFAQTLPIHDRTMVNLTTEYIWYFYLTPSQKKEFTTLADKANKINYDKIQINADNINRIYRLNTPQITNDPVVNNFYNGSNFNEGLVSSILPAGHGSTLFGHF